MAEQGGAPVPVASDIVKAIVTMVVSPTCFISNALKGYGDNYFQDWDVYCNRVADGSGSAPQGDKVNCASFQSESGIVNLVEAFDTASLQVGDTVLLMHPFYGENTYITDQPSDELKQSSDDVVTTAAVALTKVKELAWTGRVGGARVSWWMKGSGGGLSAYAVVYKNGSAIVVNSSLTPVYTLHTNVTSSWVVYTQDIYGLSTGELIQIYAYNTAGGINTIQNFRISYDIVALPTVDTIIDSVYFDINNGVAGTDRPIGTAGTPSNNITDALAIMASRRLSKLVMVGGNIAVPQTVTFISSVNIQIIGGEGYVLVFNHPGQSSFLTGDLCISALTVTSGTVTVSIDTNMNGNLVVNGIFNTDNLTCYDISGAGTIAVGQAMVCHNITFSGVIHVVQGIIFNEIKVLGTGQIDAGNDVNGILLTIGPAAVFGTYCGNIRVNQIDTSGQLFTYPGNLILTGSWFTQTGGSTNIGGTALLSGVIISGGNFYSWTFESNTVNLTGATSLMVYGDALVNGNWVNGACLTSISGKLQLYGDLTAAPVAFTCLSMDVGGNVDLTGTTAFLARGDVKVGGNWVNAACSMIVKGVLRVIGTLTSAVPMTYRGLTQTYASYTQPNDLNENDAIVIAADRQELDIKLDCSALTQANTIREYVVVGVVSCQISAKIFPTDFDTGAKSVILSFVQDAGEYRITMQSNVLEGAIRAIPYRIMRRKID